MKSCSCHTWSLATRAPWNHPLLGALVTVRPLGEASYGHQHGRRSSQTEGGQQGAICAMKENEKNMYHVYKVYKTVGFISKTKCTKGLKRMKEERWLFQRMNHDKPLGGDRWGHLWHQNIYETLQFGGIATSTAPVWGRESQTISTATSGPWVLILGAGNGCFETPFWG